MNVLKRFFLKVGICSLPTLVLFILLSLQNAYAQSVDSLKQLLNRAKSSKEKLDINIALSEATFTKDFKIAIKYAQEAVVFAKVQNQSDDLIKAYKNLATILFYAGLFEQATSYVVLCKEEAKKASNTTEELNANLNLGVMSLGVENYKKAREVFLEGEKIIFSTYQSQGKQPPLNDLTVLYTNIGLCNIMLNEVDQGFNYLNKASLILDTSSTSQLQYAKILQAYGLGYTRQKKADSAIEKLLNAKKILAERGEIVQLVGINLFLGQAYEEKGSIGNAIKLYHEGFAGSELINSLYVKKQFSEALHLAFDKLGNKDSSYKYMKLSRQLGIESNDVKAKEELAKQELLNEFNQREGELKKENQQMQRNFLFSILGLSTLCIGFLWLLVIYRKKYRVTSLAKLKLELEQEKMLLENELLSSKIDLQDSHIIDLKKKIDTKEILQQLVSELQTVEKPALQFKETEETDFSSVPPAQLQIWKDFETRFLQMHNDFYDKLIAACPQLTTNERRLCAFLKMDMSTKEIATITGQSVRSINMARFRLRQKLKLTNSETSLFDFLATL